ncbi:MAG: DEAD/DEAH box helicase family protein [Myxococcaceae bacterium]|nr:DEAD/DEAH box helicase family protein [Myxococcaceae bacterium]
MPPPSPLLPGQKVRYLPQPEWGVGHLLALGENGAKAQVDFPARDGGPVVVSTRQGALVHVSLAVGEPVRAPDGRAGLVKAEVEGGRGLKRYEVKLIDGTEDEWPESELRALAPRPDALSLLREGRVGEATAFLLRRSALMLDDERRCDALGGLLASRVMVKPHQVAVVQRVLQARAPRFVLADEVGLGKTIEAGMVFSALRLAGLARRVLVVAPSHLTVQWLVELFHKFNALFTLMDGERHEKASEEQPGVSPWARFDLVITSLEQLQRTEQHRKEVGAPEAAWDLVIIDEAHHLKAEKAFEAAQALARNTWGLLLLTATPMQLDPAEYRSLLTLIDPGTAPSVEQLEERLKRQQELSTAVRALLSGKGVAEAVKTLVSRFPADPVLAKAKGEALLAHLAETYSLSDTLVRNRRAVVGGFSSRVLHRHAVKPPADEVQARAKALEALQSVGTLKGAALAGMIRRLESSPAALAAAGAGALSLPERDAKLTAFLQVLKGIWKAEPQAKVLVFTEALATLDWLQKRLLDERVESLAYHGDLQLVERDRQVARFRDPEGPKVLICTEVGGEGRNFQFAHHLVCYDLPWSPSVVEQRIGRLDRIGQVKPVEIHVFDVEGTFASEVLKVLADAVGVFGETIGGLDAVLEEVEGELTRLALEEPKARAKYVKALGAKVKGARESLREAWDPLLDRRSFDEGAVKDLIARAQARFGLDAEDEESLDEGLQALSRDLDERLEETTTELALRVGIGVDTDQQVDAFQCAFHLGHALNVEALPGLDISRERTVLGSFWRDTAVEQEENEYFATGHPVVESLFGFLRDGQFGRCAARYVELKRAPPARGLEVLFHVTLPEPADTSVGARVPSRQLARFLDRQLIAVAVAGDGRGGFSSQPTLLELLRSQDGAALKGEDLRGAFPELRAQVDPLVEAATRGAEAELQKLRKKAKAGIEAERDARVRRLSLGLEHQGVARKDIDAALGKEIAHADALLKALEGTGVALDSVCAFVLNR